MSSGVWVPEWSRWGSRLQPGQAIRVPVAVVVDGCGEPYKAHPGWACSRRVDHGGRHHAATSDGYVWAVWQS